MRKEVDHRYQNRLEILVFAWTYVGIGLGVGLLHYYQVIDLASALMLGSILVMLVSFLLPNSLDPMVATITEGDEEIEGFLISTRITLTPTPGTIGGGGPLYMIEIRMRFPNSISPKVLAYSQRKRSAFFGGETHHIWVDDDHPHRDALHLSLQAFSKGSGMCIQRVRCREGSPK